MIQITLFILNSLLISTVLWPELVAGDIFPLPYAETRQPCDFNEVTRTYNATDLLLCMNELAKNIVSQQNSKVMSDRAYQDYQDRRQSYPVYPYAPDYSVPSNGATSNHYLDQTISTLWSEALRPNFPNLFNLNSLIRPGNNIFSALSSISQNDDLKCVPRILCEVASGSVPGSLTYKQNTNFQNFGSNALFGLLSAFDQSGTSPIITFGKAALLGITNRGESRACYREYSRCPQNSDQLVYYLNNHNGGFFRFFRGSQSNYYRPQYPYKPYYGNHDAEYRITQSNDEYPSLQTTLKTTRPEADRTGTGQLTFDYSDFYKKENSNHEHYSTKFQETGSNRVVFPKEKRESNLHSNHLVKSQDSFNYLSFNSIYGPNSRDGRAFFPQINQENIAFGLLAQKNHSRKSRIGVLNDKGTFIYFPDNTVHRDTTSFKFPNNLRNNI